MDTPLAFTVPQSAQIHIHVGNAAPLPCVRGDGSLDAPRRKPLHAAALALLLFGSGYAVHGLTTSRASAEGDQPGRISLPVLPDPPAGTANDARQVAPSLGPGRASLAPNIRLTPPHPYAPGMPAPPPSVSNLAVPTPPVPGLQAVPGAAADAGASGTAPVPGAPPRSPFGLD
jgi:hypothetical protein